MIRTKRPPEDACLLFTALMAYWAEHTETLGAAAAFELAHENGHRFNLSDTELEKIEAAAG